MQLHRFYLRPPHNHEDLLHLDGREGHHALRVLRLKRGDGAMVLDGAGNEFVCEVENTAGDQVSLAVKKKKVVAPLPCSVTIFVGIPKGKIVEDIIQKAVELGVRRIAPLLTERVVTRLDEAAAARKREQWQQVAIESMKQSGAAWLPEVLTPAPIQAFLSEKPTFDLQLVGSLQKERRHPRDVFRDWEKANSHPPRTAGVWIGPEGDLAPDELKAIIAGGAQPISLGSLVLRVETAVIYCLSVLNYEFNSIEK